MYPNHYIERRLFSNSSRQLAKESHLYRCSFMYGCSLYFVVSRTEADNLPIVYPRIPDDLICNIVVWKLTGENCSYRRKACTIATLSTTNSTWNALTVTPVTAWLRVASDDSVTVQYVMGYYCTVLLSVCFWYWRWTQYFVSVKCDCFLLCVVKTLNCLWTVLSNIDWILCG
jgi:hypothetical protein